MSYRKETLDFNSSKGCILGRAFWSLAGSSRQNSHATRKEKKIICKFLRVQLGKVAAEAGLFFFIKESWRWQSSHQLMQIPVRTKKGPFKLPITLLLLKERKEKHKGRAGWGELRI